MLRHKDVQHTDTHSSDTAPEGTASHTDVTTPNRITGTGKQDVVYAEGAGDGVVAKRVFGGLDVPASLTGMLVALSMELLLAALVVAIAGATFNFGNLTADLAVGSVIAAVAIMFVAYMVGGWAAARMARYDGLLNGMMTAVWAVLLAAITATVGAVLGDRYDLFSSIGLPSWFSEGLTTAAIISGLAALAAMLIGGAVGGLIGDRYHRKVDSAVEDGSGGGIFRRRNRASIH